MSTFVKAATTLSGGFLISGTCIGYGTSLAIEVATRGLTRREHAIVGGVAAGALGALGVGLALARGASGEALAGSVIIMVIETAGGAIGSLMGSAMGKNLRRYHEVLRILGTAVPAAQLAGRHVTWLTAPAPAA